LRIPEKSISIKSMKIGNAGKLVLGLLVVLLAGYAIHAWVNATFVPTAFSDTRKQSAVIAAEVVLILNESFQNLGKISEEDRNYNFRNALDLVYTELDRIKLAQEKAIMLSDTLNTMARVVPDIMPVEARNLALTGVSKEVSLISNLVIYNHTLNGLLETLRYKFSGDIRYDAEDVQKLVYMLNQQGKEINAINDSFNETMREFDQVVK